MTDTTFYCPFLQGTVHLTSERIVHIRNGHPELRVMELVTMIETIRMAIENPSIIVRSRKDGDGMIFGRWEPSIFGGKFVVVTVITSMERNWVITAFISRYKPKGEILWTQD